MTPVHHLPPPLQGPPPPPLQGPPPPRPAARPVAPVVEKAKLTDREPVALVGAIQGVIIATLAVLTGFGIVSWSEQQMGLILALTLAVMNALQAFARSKVWSPASVRKLLDGQ